MRDIDQLLPFIRAAIRRQKPYLVGGLADPEVKLNQNENPYDLPHELKREIVETFMAIPFNRYPAEQPWALARAIARHVGHDEEGILVGNGSNELVYTLGLTMVGAGTPVVLPTPMFSLYGSVVRMHEGALVSVPPREDLSFDAEAIRAAVRTHRPALTVLTTPNNPTGLAMPIEEVEAIVAEAEGFVVVDEAYVEFTREVSALSILDQYPNLILMRTFSKAHGLAGLRLGYLLAHPAVVTELMKARLPFMIDRFAETTALVLLKQPELLRERVALLKGHLRQLVAGLEELPGVETLPTQANFVLFKTPVEPPDLMRRLAEAGILVRDMSGYAELKGWLRVNAGTPAENNAFLDALKSAL